MHNDDNKVVGLKERVLCAVGDKLAKMAVSPRDCWVFAIYEPELSPEMINRFAEDDI